MKCVHIDKFNALFMLLSTFLNNIHLTQLADNSMDIFVKDSSQKNATSTDFESFKMKTSTIDLVLPCPTDVECSQLNAPCIKCDYNLNCVYGDVVNISCQARQEVKCKEHRTFQRSYMCKYCYQTEEWEHDCELKASCNSIATPRHYYRSNCTVKPHILCLGNRKFFKNIQCSWTVGYRWSTALILSITLGGFGADRFYLGHWQEGIGKLFSFGGLGVWTLVDVILISLHYLGPADGSLYI